MAARRYPSLSLVGGPICRIVPCRGKGRLI
jgi:hypothetical protein